MASELVRGLIDAGVHFGHQASRWNPLMSPFIHGKRNGIHIIDIRETVRGLLRAKKFLAAVVSQGLDALIVGTKRQARDAVEKQAKRVGMHYVNERWLGGTLTNFKTIRSRLARLEHLEGLFTTGKINELTKKERAVVEREKRKITRNLDGIRRMTRLPGVLIILDVRREHIAVKEARKLGIPTICLVDSDSDPTVGDIIIPGNDDAMRAIELLVAQLADAVEEGMRGRPTPAEPGAESGPQPGSARPRRSRRMSGGPAGDAATAEAAGDDASMPMEAVAGPAGGAAAPVSDSL